MEYSFDDLSVDIDKIRKEVDKAREKKKLALEKEKQLALEKEKKPALEKEKQLALEKEKKLALEKEKKLAIEKWVFDQSQQVVEGVEYEKNEVHEGAKVEVSNLEKYWKVKKDLAEAIDDFEPEVERDENLSGIVQGKVYRVGDVIKIGGKEYEIDNETNVYYSDGPTSTDDDDTSTDDNDGTLHQAAGKLSLSKTDQSNLKNMVKGWKIDLGKLPPATDNNKVKATKTSSSTHGGSRSADVSEPSKAAVFEPKAAATGSTPPHRAKPSRRSVGKPEQTGPENTPPQGARPRRRSDGKQEESDPGNTPPQGRGKSGSGLPPNVDIPLKTPSPKDRSPLSGLQSTASEPYKPKRKSTESGTKSGKMVPSASAAEGTADDETPKPNPDEFSKYKTW